MDIFDVYVIDWNSPWWIAALALGVVVLGWMSRPWIGRQVAKFVHLTPIPNWLVRRLALTGTEPIAIYVDKLVRALTIALSLWGAWLILDSHPDNSALIRNLATSVSEFARLPMLLFLFDALLIALGTFVLFKLIHWTRQSFNAYARQIELEKGRGLKGIKIQRVQLFTDEQVVALLLRLNRYARLAVNLVFLFGYFAGIFSIFPETRGIAAHVVQGVLNAFQVGWQGFIDYLPSLINLTVIIAVTFYGLKILRFIFSEIGKGTINFSGFYPEWAKPTFQLVRFMVMALALVVAFPFLPGSSSPAFQGVSVFIGLLLSLGSASVVSNIVSGVVLTYTRAFRIGDRVKIGDTLGDIIEKGLLVTRIRTIKNVDITIPNGIVMSNHVINYSAISQQQGLILNTTVTLGYDIPWRKIHEALIKAALTTPGVLNDPKPFILQTALSDFYVHYELNAYTNQPNDMATIYSDLHRNIQDACNEAGIEILSPHYNALRDGNDTAIPANYLPQNHVVPSFQVKIDPSSATARKQP